MSEGKTIILKVWGKALKNKSKEKLFKDLKEILPKWKTQLNNYVNDKSLSSLNASRAILLYEKIKYVEHILKCNQSFIETNNVFDYIPIEKID